MKLESAEAHDFVRITKYEQSDKNELEMGRTCCTYGKKMNTGF
jgi:hypothetical protein